MKYLKYFENKLPISVAIDSGVIDLGTRRYGSGGINLTGLKKGDYVYVEIDSFFYDFESHSKIIQKSVGVCIGNTRSDYIIEYTIQDKTFTIYVTSEIKYYSSNYDDVKMYIEMKKYNM